MAPPMPYSVPSFRCPPHLHLTWNTIRPIHPGRATPSTTMCHVSHQLPHQLLESAAAHIFQRHLPISQISLPITFLFCPVTFVFFCYHPPQFLCKFSPLISSCNPLAFSGNDSQMFAPLQNIISEEYTKALCSSSVTACQYPIGFPDQLADLLSSAALPYAYT